MNKGASEKTKYAIWSLCGIGMAIPVVFLVLWICGGEEWKSFVGLRMKFNTGIGLLAAGIALFLQQPKDAGIRRRLSGRVFAFIATVIGGATVLEYFGDIQLGIDELFVEDVRNAESALFPGRMAPNSALGLFLAGLAFLLMDVGARWRKVALSLALVASSLSLFCLIGYLFGAHVLYQPAAYIRMSPYTATVILLFSFAFVLARPRLGLARLLLSETSVGGLGRRMFVAALTLPIVIGWIFSELRYSAAMDEATADALTALATIFALLGFVWVKAERIWRAEDQIKKSEQRFRTMANSIPQIAWIANATGEIVWINQRGRDYLDPAVGEILGADWSGFQHPDHRRRVMDKFEQHLSASEPWEDTFPMRGREGEWRWFLTRAVPVTDESGEVTSWFGTNTDITEKLETERELKESKDAAEKANMAKTQFLANVSHELRTPVAAITGFVDLLRIGGASPSERENYLEIVARNAKHLLSLIDDVLDLSKIEAGKTAIEESLVDLTEFLADFEATMKLKALEKGVQLKISAATSLPDRFMSDPVRLRQVLCNVVGNAIKFTEKGRIEIIMAFENSELSFGVRDTGIGIAVEAIPHLFQPFAQADASSNRRYGGTGLGLVLSRRLCRTMGGDLVLIGTRPGGGSEFKASVRCSLPPDAAMIRFGESQVLQAPGDAGALGRGFLALNGLRILVVDDSLDNRLLISTYLSKAGAQVLTADDGEEGVSRALAANPDLILMDIQMPKLDGYEATRRLRARDFARPIVALTAHAMREERERCLAAGCWGYITKPVRREYLIEVIQDYCSAGVH